MLRASLDSYQRMSPAAMAAFVFLAVGRGVNSQRLRIKNGCYDEPLWVAHMAQVDSGPDSQNLKLCPGESHTFHTPNGLSGTRYWAKMRCNSIGDECEIGESGGPGETCNSQIGCAPPVDTKFEASFGANGVDWVDVSLVDGWTLPFNFKMSKQCRPGDGNRKVVQEIDCSELAFDGCPHAEDVGRASNSSVDLRVRHPNTGAVVGCYSPCSKLTFNNWGNKGAKYGPSDNLAKDYCCPTPPESPQACRAGPVKGTKFVRAIHQNCPGVYGYSYDDGMGLLLCPQDTVYEMTFFCPAGTGQKARNDDRCRKLPPLALTTTKAHPQKDDKADAYDCTLYDDDVPNMWPFEQAAWCCLHRRIGCPNAGKSTEGDRSTLAIAMNRHSTTTAVSTTMAPVATSKRPAFRHSSLRDEFDCSTGFSMLWSPKRADWCCVHKGRGCYRREVDKEDNEAEAAASEIVSSERTTSEGSYDCLVGYPQWIARWSGEKKAWCCKHANRACPTTVIATTTSVEYSCIVWRPEEDQKWSPTKRDWCCKHENKGCLATTTARPAPPEEPITTYNCVEFPANLPLAAWGDITLEPVESWSSDKRDWCCRHEHRGCGSEIARASQTVEKTTNSSEYDCHADFWGWMVNWGEEKKEWCCRHEQRGCVKEHTWIGYAARKFTQPPGPPPMASATLVATSMPGTSSQHTGLLASVALLATLAAGAPCASRAACVVVRRAFGLTARDGRQPPVGAAPLVEVDMEEDSCIE